MKFTDIEQEVIFLKATTETIDAIVNHDMLTRSEGEEAGEARFKTTAHQRLFNIILVDFLSKSAAEITRESKSYLDALIDICERPMFDQDHSVLKLEDATRSFKQWLEIEVEVEMWLPAISLDTKLRILRREFIKICGNIAKHNFSRLSRIVNDLRDIVSRNGITIADEDALLILDDFYERFHTDILNYHASYIVEQLNDIRWGIHAYLEPEFRRSIVYENGVYHYTYPDGISAHFAKNCYSELMNEVRRKPYLQRFKTYDILKKAY